MKCSYLIAVAAALTIGSFAQSAQAQWQPDRPVTMIVPYAAGGGTDAFARAIVPNLEEALGQPVAIVNRPGSTGVVGTTEAASARPDGTTILLALGGGLVLADLFSGTPFDLFEDFETVAQIGVLTTAIAVPADGAITSANDLVERATSGEALRWAHAGRGGAHYLAVQSFLDANGIEAVDVPFSDGPGVRAAILGSQVDFAAIGVQQGLGFEDGMRLIGLISENRDPIQPDIPTIPEQGLPYVNIYTPVTIHLPAGAPAEIAASLEAAIRDATEAERFAEAMLAQGNAPEFLSGEDANQALEQIRENARPVVEQLSSQ